MVKLNNKLMRTLTFLGSGECAVQLSFYAYLSWRNKNEFQMKERKITASCNLIACNHRRSRRSLHDLPGQASGFLPHSVTTANMFAVSVIVYICPTYKMPVKEEASGLN